MTKGARKSNVGYVYGALEELQQLREEVAMLREKNHSLAKQLNVTKMELAREFKRQEVQIALQLKALMKPPRKQMSGTAEFGVQCDLSASGNEESESNNSTLSVPGDAPSTPPRSRRATSSSSPHRSLSPTAKAGRRDRSRASAHEISADDDVQMQSPPPIRQKQRKHDPLPIHHEDEVSGSLADELDVRRRLRFRSVEVSYVEPPLNRKIRQGDFYGLLRRPRVSSSGTEPSQPNCSHNRRLVPPLAEPTRTTRLRKPISYVLPKLNTKLRQGDKFTFTT